MDLKNTVFNLNSVPVFVTELSEDEKISYDDYKTLTQLPMSKREDEKTFSTMLSDSSQILEHPALSKLKSTKLKYIDHYVKNILGCSNKLIMTSSWLTMNQNGSVHERHSHGNVILSSVLYFSENLIDINLAPFYISQKGLSNVFKSFQFQYDIENYNEYNSTNLSLTPKTNTLIIFPGWMLHGSEPQQSRQKRYCIGSNYFLNDTVGTGYHSLSVSAKIIDTSIK